MKDPRLFCVASRLEEVQKEIDVGEWEGMAPEALMYLLFEEKQLKALSQAGMTIGTNF